MSDLEQLLPARLHALADDLARDPGPANLAAAARARHRRQRQARIALTAVAVAVIAVAVGVPTAFEALSAPPAGRVAGPVTTSPSSSVPTDSAAAARAQARALAQEAAASAAAESAAAAASPGPAGRMPIEPAAQAILAAEAARGAAELTEALLALDSPVHLGAAPAAPTCPDAAAVLSSGLGRHVAYEQGALTDGRDGCQWSTDGDATWASQPEQRLTVGVDYVARPSASVLAGLQRFHALDEPGRCLSVPVTAVDPQAVLQRCTKAGAIDWSLYVPSAEGAATWVLSALVGDDISSPNAGAALVQVAALATAHWGD